MNSSGSNLSEESHDFTSSLSVTKLNDIRHLDDLDGYRPESQQQSIVQLNSDMSSPKPRLLQLKPFSLKLAKVTDNFQKVITCTSASIYQIYQQFSCYFRILIHTGISDVNSGTTILSQCNIMLCIAVTIYSMHLFILFVHI